MQENINITPAGDSALRIAFKNEISERVNNKVNSLCQAIDKSDIHGFINCIPAYCTLLVEYDPLVMDYSKARSALEDIEVQSLEIYRGKQLDIPVCYGGEYGPDINYVAEYTGIDEKTLVEIHSAVPYRVYMLGFRPGFPYLGGLDRRIHAPRKESPRGNVVAGSIGIAGGQTGVYPEASPGGWQIIGRTPLRLYDSDRNPACLLSPGDTLRFVPINHFEFQRISDQGYDNYG